MLVIEDSLGGARINGDSQNTRYPETDFLAHERELSGRKKDLKNNPKLDQASSMHELAGDFIF
jgi:hypothetical protein